MTRSEAQELRDIVGAQGGCESAAVRPAKRGGYRLTVRMVGEPPRTYSSYRAAFDAYCGVLEPDE